MMHAATLQELLTSAYYDNFLGNFPFIPQVLHIWPGLHFNTDSNMSLSFKGLMCDCPG